MAWATPNTWKVGTTLTSIGAHTIFNQDIRDSVNFLYNPPRAQVYRSSSDSITSDTETQVNIDTEEIDTDAMWTSPNRYIECVTAGCYLAFANVGFDSIAAVASSRAFIQGQNGTPFDRLATSAMYHTENSQLYHELAASAELAVGHRVRLLAWQNSGGAISTVGGADKTYLGVFWVGGL